MSDLFHKEVPLAFIQRAFDVMARCPQHQFQILTKRAARLRQVANALNWAPNIWMGVSVEDQKRTQRAAFARLGGADDPPLVGGSSTDAAGSTIRTGGAT